MSVLTFGSRSSKINEIEIMMSHFNRNKIEIMENKLIGRSIDM